jgi:hypothetical protein
MKLAKLAFLMVLVFGISGCAVLHRSYSVDVVIPDGRYSKDIFAGDEHWEVDKFSNVAVFQLSLRKAESAAPSLERERFELSATSSGYEVSIYPLSVALGEYTVVTVRNKMGRSTPSMDERAVLIEAHFSEGGVDSFRDIRVQIKER